NFKKRKLKCPDAFRGLPRSIDAVLPRVNCVLGLPLDHPWHEMDHSWVWGDGILDLSLASDCVMTFANPKDGVYCDTDWMHGIRKESACLGAADTRVSITLRVLTAAMAFTEEASVNLAYLSIMNDAFEFDPDMALVVKVAPEDQLDLTPEELEKE
ncbi:alkB, alkylation repair 4, partial [Perkinsus olseni]